MLIAFILSVLFSGIISAANVTKVTITTKEPLVGEKQSFKASVPETASTEFYEVHWSGEFKNGRFVQGNNYTMTDRLRIKASSSNVFAPASKINATINGHKGKVSVVREYKAISVKYTWKELGGPNHNNPKTELVSVIDRLQSGRTFRVLNIIDDCDRVAVRQEISMSMPAERVIKLLEKVIWLNGKPKNIRCDNGPKYISKTFREWCKGNDINIIYIQPGHPTQNSIIERFNGSYRRTVLDAYIFRTLHDEREQTEAWMIDYNECRPQESLDNMTPMEYQEKKKVG